MVSSEMLRRVTLVRTDVSEELSASLIRVTKIGELGTTLAVASNRHTLRRNISCRFLQEPHGVTSQKTPFFKLIFVEGFLEAGIASNEIRGMKFRFTIDPEQFSLPHKGSGPIQFL
jgi:hypothetical protein